MTNTSFLSLIQQVILLFFAFTTVSDEFAGQEEFDNFRQMSYDKTSVFIVCFSVMNPESCANVLDIWFPEVLVVLSYQKTMFLLLQYVILLKNVN
jgi:GTPase SAR1 family protein